MGSSEEEEWLIVYRGFDPVQLDLVDALLGSEGIETRRLGPAHPALLGAGDSAVVQMISVAAGDAEEARKLIVWAESGPQSGDDEDDDESEDDDEHGEPIARESESSVEGSRSRPPPRKVRFIAAGMSAVWPGFGLAYAGAWCPGAALAVWAGAAPLSREWPARLAGAVFAQLVARIVDVAASQWLLSRRSGRAAYGVFQQVLAALLLVGAMQWTFTLVGVPLARRVLAAMEQPSGDRDAQE